MNNDVALRLAHPHYDCTPESTRLANLFAASALSTAELRHAEDRGYRVNAYWRGRYIGQYLPTQSRQSICEEVAASVRAS